MHHLYRSLPIAALFVVFGLATTASNAVELEGALQYPPPSVGQDAQPPPPARMVPQPLSPRRIEMGVSGTSAPPQTQRFYTRPPLRSGAPAELPPTGAGGN
jgi:hypothetical protein